MQKRPHITLKPLWHNQEKCIAIEFDYNETVKNYVQQFSEIKWSETHKTFYARYHKGGINELFNYFRLQNWYVNYEAFKVSTNQTNDLIILKKTL